MSTQREIALGMVVTAWVASRITPGVKTLREIGKREFVSGESAAAVSPVDGSILGKVTRTKPSPVARVEDEAALMAHVHEEDPDQLVDVDYISGSNADVIAALKHSHPHLVGQRVEITAHHLKYLLTTAENDKTFRPPGVAVDTPVGTVNIYPAKDMDAAFMAVVKSGAVALDGTVRPALPGGSE